MTEMVHSFAAFSPLARFLLMVALLGTLSSTFYLLLVLVAALRYVRRVSSDSRKALATPESKLPSVTILKPVHGLEPKLAENLASFFEQDYPEFEIIIGARDAGNAALSVAREVCARYPHVPSRIVLSGPPIWPNAKAFSLDKMIAESKYSFLVLSDSDVCVRRDLLRHVVPPLLDHTNGAVTCVYRGVPAGDPVSLLEGLGMSTEMTSGVLVADMMEGMRFALGIVIAVRRDSLDAIGGIRMTANYYSDDFVLGNEVWKAGYKVVLSHHKADHVLLPRGWRDTIGDQLRWMKSTRYSRPAGHVGTGLTYAVPYGVLGWIGAMLGGAPALAWLLLGVTWLNRMIQSVAVGYGVIGDERALKYCWLYPVRDLLGFGMWLVSFASHNFRWRGETYRFNKGGRITPKLRHAVDATAGTSGH